MNDNKAAALRLQGGCYGQRLTMENEKTLEILQEMKADTKAKELLEGMEDPASPDEAISAYAHVSGKLGYVSQVLPVL